MIQPFEIIRSLKSSKYRAVFVSDSEKLPINERERFNVFVELDPWDNLINFRCECKGFKYSKGKILCRHLYSKYDNRPHGLLHQLYAWGEIDKIPTIKNEA